MRREWWNAFTYYRSKVQDKKRQIIRRIDEGVVVMLDNWRVLHGREAFSFTKSDQSRVLETAYVNWNHVQSRILAPREGGLYLELPE